MGTVNKMTRQVIFAEQVVSLSDYRKNPGQYFLEEPVAVLSKNKPAGYVMGPELFEQLMKALESLNGEVQSQFRPARNRLEVIAKLGDKLLAEATEDELGEFRQE